MRNNNIHREVMARFKERHGISLLEQIQQENLDLHAEINTIVDDTISLVLSRI